MIKCQDVPVKVCYQCCCLDVFWRKKNKTARRQEKQFSYWTGAWDILMLDCCEGTISVFTGFKGFPISSSWVNASACFWHFLGLFLFWCFIGLFPVLAFHWPFFCLHFPPIIFQNASHHLILEGLLTLWYTRTMM